MAERVPRVMTPADLGLATLAELVDSALDGIAVVDCDGDLLRYVNPAGCRLLGRLLEELTGRPATMFGPSGGTPSTSRVRGRELEHVTTAVSGSGSPLRVVRFRDVTEARRQERRLKAFSRTSASIAFAGRLNTVLDRLAADVRHATGMVACTFLLMDPDGELRQAGASGPYPGVDDYAERLKACRTLGAPLLSASAFQDRRPAVAVGWREQTLADPRFAPLHDISRSSIWHTIAVVPLMVRGTVTGVLNGYYGKGDEPSEADVAFLTAIADHAAVAVDNARLLQQLESKAALEERHRLARELHDSVSQALFSLTLQARAVELSLTGDGSDVALALRGIAEIRELTRGALAEMRALIFQLRPDALDEEGLVSAVRKHAAAVEAKEQLRIRVEGPDYELPLPVDVETQLFRVAQEALHNVVKHAAASSVVIRVVSLNNDLVFEIEDDGCGFDPRVEHPGHLGLRSMAERLAELGGTLEVHSVPRRRTIVRGVVPGALGTEVTAGE